MDHLLDLRPFLVGDPAVGESPGADGYAPGGHSADRPPWGFRDSPDTDGSGRRPRSTLHRPPAPLSTRLRECEDPNPTNDSPSWSRSLPPRTL